MNKHDDINRMSFEEALAELQTIVKGIEVGQNSLEQAIVAYERGNLLKAHCESKLKEAKLKIEKILKQNEDGTVSTEVL